MIIANIIGGLGNQMFQYAAGLSLSQAKNTELSLDLDAFSSYGLHIGFELSRVFDINAAQASTRDFDNVLGWRGAPEIRRYLQRSMFSVLRGSRFVTEPYFNYWPGLFDVSDNVYLVGYWQSEQYFKMIEVKLRERLTFKLALTGVNRELAIQILDCESVSIHIRRGDYAHHAKTHATHGLLSLDYYNKAIESMIQSLQVPQFFVFSDDITWAKEKLELAVPARFIEHNQGLNSSFDMHLMSLCRHHIIANSSFSWWGAWLNPSKHKMVIAPEQWFANSSGPLDLLPPEWLRL